ncbi:hypothetical protein SAMN05421578_108205 [Paenibacillus macquariensis]|uniref:Uncharacterized protein n=1 Tax=Paenibacillus macquariensis TaxID=948756 RepID=A0ABY1K3K8_9BACL|nr:hypothetical protein SAMN05421578_108205 [Paenibacillus macquariensis]
MEFSVFFVRMKGSFTFNIIPISLILCIRIVDMDVGNQFTDSLII